MFKWGTKTEARAPAPDLAAEHFKLCFYAAVLRVIEQTALALGSFEEAFAQFPFLVGYNNELAQRGLGGLRADEAWQRWRELMQQWEAGVSEHLPLRALRAAARLDDEALTMWFCVGLPEEDARFGAVFATLQGTPGQSRPTAGLLNAWAEAGAERATVQHLLAVGLVQIPNPTAPRSEWQAQMPAALWDALRGPTAERPTAWARYQAPAQLAAPEELILPEDLQAQLQRLPSLLAAGDASALIVRGPAHNGRRTLAGAVARSLQRGLLELQGLSSGDDERWRLVGPLATLLHATPVLALDLALGETVALPVLQCYSGPLFVVLNQQGGVSGTAVECAITLTLEMPNQTERQAHWNAALNGTAPAAEELAAIARHYRLTGGNIRRIAQLALTQAKLDARTQISRADVQEASRALHRQTLDALASRLKATGDWGQLATGTQTLAELYQLENRCRRREQLHAAVGPALRTQLNAGVRALFSGPSGTGKTLAARLLAAALQKDIYRVDLSSVVNKYIGETEKNLQQLFARAEELDVILLLDEGDALLTQRTNVQTANDRYANLETNYLLQRLETFEGVLIVTTNAGERIDSAFQRRMDVVIDFRPPEAAERLAIWELHLPEAHAVDERLLREIAGRCVFTGGQIRNAVLHASLLALEDGGVLRSSHLEAAVQREYRKAGAVCPLRRVTAFSAI